MKRFENLQVSCKTPCKRMHSFCKLFANNLQDHLSNLQEKCKLTNQHARKMQAFKSLYLLKNRLNRVTCIDSMKNRNSFKKFELFTVIAHQQTCVLQIIYKSNININVSNQHCFIQKALHEGLVVSFQMCYSVSSGS